MYSLLIAEDEILERRMLEKIIRKEFPSISRLLIAEHGLEALALARAHHPDILLADINMPGMTGMELIRTLRQEAFDCPILILTAYNDFLYAQQAIDHEVTGYLLKPVDAAELRKHLGKCFERIDQRAQMRRAAAEHQQNLRRLTTYVRPQLMREMLSGVVPEHTLRAICGWPDEETLQCAVLWVQYADAPPKSMYTALLHEKLSAYDEYFSFVNIWEGNNLLIVMQPLHPMDAEQMYIALWLLAERFGREPAWPKVFVSKINDNYEGLRDTLARKDTFFPRTGDIPPHFLPSLASLPPRERASRMKKAQVRFKEQDVVRVFSLFSKRLSDPLRCWSGVYLFLMAYRGYDDTDALVDLLCQLDRENAPASVRAFLESGFGAVSSGTLDSVIVENALSLMRQHFASPGFSQAWLAEELGLSQAYFSRLFRKVMGTSFIARLTEIRMAAALKPLREGMSVPEVASMCGYQSAKYFTIAFRQHFGYPIHQCRAAGKTMGEGELS